MAYSDDEGIPVTVDVDKEVDSTFLTEPMDPYEAEDPQGLESQTSFTADSPYYSAFVDQEVNNLQTLSMLMHDISGRTKTFGKAGRLMSEAMRRLSLSCKLRPPIDEALQLAAEDELDPNKILKHRKKAVGEEMTTLLGTLGEVSSV